MLRSSKWTRLGTLGIVLGTGFSSWSTEPLLAQQPAVVAAPAKVDRAVVVAKAVAFLKQAQAEDGTWSKQVGSGVTAIVTTALLQNGVAPSDPVVAKSLKYLAGLAQADGGIYVAESTNKNYETCCAILCLKEANQNKQYDKLIANANQFIKKLQWDEGENADKSNVNYGGAGYGKKNRPDMSNTSFLIEALRSSGNKPDDENIQKALTFISRCQNLESEHNTTAFAAKINDGGFYYTVANGGESFAPESSAEGGLRSYASMTYAGLKSFIYAGLSKDDKRVQAAKAWIAKHYDLNSNPGLGDMGLYYYYHVFAKTMHLLGEPTVTDAQGVKHDWKVELTAALASRQNENGSWVNKNARFMETDPNLVTAYALLSLAVCQ
jgi:squalene-hopene/tetraprenyl-beta-curcumene cyclase